MRNGWPTGLVVLALGCGGKIDSDTTGTESSKGSGAPGDPSATGAGASSSGGGGASSNRRGNLTIVWTRPTCANKTPLRQTFEGMPSDWSGALGGLDFDKADPLEGTASLKIDVARAVGFKAMLLKQHDGGCAAETTLRVRVGALFPSGQAATLFRIGIPPGGLDLVLDATGNLSLVEILDVMAPGVAGASHPLGAVQVGTPTTVRVIADLSTRTVHGALSTAGASAVTASLAPTTGPRIGNVLLGFIHFAPNASATSGSYWLDDFALE